MFFICVLLFMSTFYIDFSVTQYGPVRSVDVLKQQVFLLSANRLKLVKKTVCMHIEWIVCTDMYLWKNVECDHYDAVNRGSCVFDRRLAALHLYS